MSQPKRVLYCHCNYANVVPPEVKHEVLKRLCASGVAFDAVADLCEMSARQDSAMKRIAEADDVRIAACFPRTVKWLFHAANASLHDHGVTVLNMRKQSAEKVAAGLLSDEAPPLEEPS